MEDMSEVDIFYEYLLKKKRLDLLVGYLLKLCESKDSPNLVNLLNTLADDPRGINAILKEDNI